MYVKEDLGHIVNMDEEAISREIAVAPQILKHIFIE